MSTTIFYYTGTGNSLWVARTLAIRLSTAELISMPAVTEEKVYISAERVGLVFPVYIWGVPAPVIKFIDKLANLTPDYLFAVAVNGGQVANTLVQLKNALAKKGLTLAAGFEITMPSNYIPWGGPGGAVEQRHRFDAAQRKLADVAVKIQDKATLPVETGPWWHRVFFSHIFYRMSYAQVPTMDKQFWVDEKCNHCEICRQVCPAGNITIHEGKPRWHHHCEQCFACLQWCPQEAIQYGKNTPKYSRYHHPEVKLKDILQSREV